MPGVERRVDFNGWPETPLLRSRRLLLEPLRVEHAEEMAPLLHDPQLHRFIGGRPPTLSELRHNYCRQVVGASPDGSQRWLNWILRREATGQGVGTVQATVTPGADEVAAEVAWVIATSSQGQGYATPIIRRPPPW